jgi:hypothetical protein
MHGMANMVQCNLSNLSGVGTPDKQIRLELHFYRQINGGLAWQEHGRGELLQY